jgi:hypothetical protein
MPRTTSFRTHLAASTTGDAPATAMPHHGGAYQFHEPPSFPGMAAETRELADLGAPSPAPMHALAGPMVGGTVGQRSDLAYGSRPVEPVSTTGSFANWRDFRDIEETGVLPSSLSAGQFSEGAEGVGMPPVPRWDPESASVISRTIAAAARATTL